MKYGLREICNVVLRAKAKTKIGTTTFEANQPVLYIDTATTSSLEGAATTVYAQGGRGYSRLIAWEGEKTLTFTLEDALISPIGLSVLSGAGLIKGSGYGEATFVNVHQLVTTTVNDDGTISDLGLAYDETNAATGKVETKYRGICENNGLIFIAKADEDGNLGDPVAGTISVTNGEGGVNKPVIASTGLSTTDAGTAVLVDFYELQPIANVQEIQIDAAHFAGYYYLEAETLFRAESDGKDRPAILTLPKVKVQSNFTFTMAATGDPSTFTFTMDAFPDYTYFNKTKKVLCAVQVVDDSAAEEDWESVLAHGVNHDVSVSI